MPFQVYFNKKNNVKKMCVILIFIFVDIFEFSLELDGIGHMILVVICMQFSVSISTVWRVTFLFLFSGVSRGSSRPSRLEARVLPSAPFSRSVADLLQLDL